MSPKKSSRSTCYERIIKTSFQSTDVAPAVSVIMPAYNVAKFIGAAIDSVLAQSFSDLEVIVIDDGSVDDTGLLVKGFNDRRIQYIRCENNGRSGARNRGLEAAKGAFIAFLDADDLWEPSKLAVQIDILNTRTDVDGVVGAFRRINENGEYLRSSGVGEGAIPISEFFSGNPVSICMATLRRKFIEDGFRFNTRRKYAEDWEFNSRLAIKGYKFIRHREIVGSYRFTPQAIEKTTEFFARSHISVVDQIHSEVGSDLVAGVNYENARFEVTLRMAARFFSAGNMELGHKFLIEASAFRPESDKIYLAKTAGKISLWLAHFGKFDADDLCSTLDKDILNEIQLEKLPERIQEKSANAKINIIPEIAGKPRVEVETGNTDIIARNSPNLTVISDSIKGTSGPAVADESALTKRGLTGILLNAARERSSGSRGRLMSRIFDAKSVAISKLTSHTFIQSASRYYADIIILLVYLFFVIVPFVDIDVWAARHIAWLIAMGLIAFNIIGAFLFGRFMEINSKQAEDHSAALQDTLKQNDDMRRRLRKLKASVDKAASTVHVEKVLAGQNAKLTRQMKISADLVQRVFQAESAMAELRKTNDSSQSDFDGGQETAIFTISEEDSGQ